MTAPRLPLVARIVTGGMGIAFVVFGCAFVSLMNDDGPFGSGRPMEPPAAVRLVVTVFGGLFALVGVTMVIGAVMGRQLLSSRSSGSPRQHEPSADESEFRRSEAAEVRHRSPDRASASSSSPDRFACPSCAAPLRDDAEISPSGDVKCPHCRSWFNVRV